MTAAAVTTEMMGGIGSAEAGNDEVAQYLTFLLGGEPFAVGIMAVKEIIEYGRVTPVPMMPRWIRGVINLRGAVVPVLDLAARFGRPLAEVTRKTCIVVVEINDGERRDVGVVVDAVSAVLDIAAADIEPPPDMGAGIKSEFIRGMGKVDGRFVIILEAERVLSDRDVETLGKPESNEEEP